MCFLVYVSYVLCQGLFCLGPENPNYDLNIYLPRGYENTTTSHDITHNKIHNDNNDNIDDDNGFLGGPENPKILYYPVACFLGSPEDPNDHLSRPLSYACMYVRIICIISCVLYIHTYICIYIYIYIHIYIYIYIYIHTYTCVYIYIYIHTYIHTYINTYTYIYAAGL